MNVKAAAPATRDKAGRIGSRAMPAMPRRKPTRRMRRRMTAMVPGAGRTARMRRRGRKAGFAGRQLARHPEPLVKGARAVNWSALMTAAGGIATAQRRERRHRMRRVVLVGAAGVTCAGVAALAIQRSRDGSGQDSPVASPPAGERSDRDVGGPTAAAGSDGGQTTGGATGTKATPGQDPHA